MNCLRTLSLLLPALTAAGPALGHVTGTDHPSGPLHPILGIDHLLIVLAVVAALAIAAVWRR